MPGDAERNSRLRVEADIAEPGTFRPSLELSRKRSLQRQAADTERDARKRSARERTRQKHGVT